MGGFGTFAEINSCLKKHLDYWILAGFSKTTHAEVEPLGLAFPLSEWISWLKSCSLGSTVFFRLFLAPCHGYSSAVTAQSGNTVKCQKLIFSCASITNTTTAFLIASSLPTLKYVTLARTTHDDNTRTTAWLKQTEKLINTNKQEMQLDCLACSRLHFYTSSLVAISYVCIFL